MNLDEIFTWPPTREKWRALKTVLKSMQIVPGIGLRVRKTGTGTVLSSTKQRTERSVLVPLHIIDACPPYIPAGDPPSEGYARLYVEWGTLNDIIAENWDSEFDINETTYFFAKAYLRGTDTLKVYRWEILTGSTSDAHATADWNVGSERPTEAVCLLGTAFFDNGIVRVSNNGGGSLVLTEHISIVQQGSSAGEVLMGKQLIFTRLNY